MVRAVIIHCAGTDCCDCLACTHLAIVWLALLMASVMKKFSMGLFRMPAAAATLPALASMALIYWPLSHTGASTDSPRAKCGATSARRWRSWSRVSYGRGTPSTSLRARRIFQSSRASPEATQAAVQARHQQVRQSQDKTVADTDDVQGARTGGRGPHLFTETALLRAYSEGVGNSSLHNCLAHLQSTKQQQQHKPLQHQAPHCCDAFITHPALAQPHV